MPYSRRITGLCALLIGLCAPAAVLANPFEHQLDNGLRIIVKEDRRAPTVVHMVWYRAGSMDESSGSTGVAHLLEHMMFKGTPSVGAGEFSRLVATAGGRDNAFTSKDYTAYFQQMPKEKLAQMIRLDADRMRHLTLDPKEFSQEIKVVMEERRLRTEDQPQAMLLEQLNATALQAHPYRVPVIGWMSDLQSMSVNDARQWYQRWYVPNNAYVVIVGDVDHQAVFRLAKRYYGALSARPVPARKPQNEPTQLGIRRLNVKAPAENPVLLMAYKVPVLRDVEQDIDPYALEMLSAILDGHEAARFSQRLVRDQRLAASAGAGYDATARGPGLFYLQGIPSDGKTPEQLEAGLRAEIERIAREGVSPEELSRAKAQLVASQTYKLDSMFAQAMEIGQLEAVGIPYQQANRMIAKLQAVTADQIKEVAIKYFRDDQLTIGLLDPQAQPKSAQPPAVTPRH